MSQLLRIGICFWTLLICMPGASYAGDNDSLEKVLNPFELVEQLADEQKDNNEQTISAPLMPTERAIAMFEARVAATPNDFRNRTVLGQLYLRDAKESDNLESFGKAVAVLREAIKHSSDYLPAKIHLAQALQAEHQFQEALELATVFVKEKPNNALGLAVLGDSQIELGLYTETAETYEKLAALSEASSVKARVAHLAELNGHPDKAIEIMQNATAQSKRSGAMPETQAWFEMRLATLYFSQGKFSQAEEHFNVSLELSKDYAPAMSGLVMIKCAQNKMTEALALARKSVETHGEPPMMAMLGDVLLKLGQADEANDWFNKTQAAMEEEAKTAASAHYREVALFLLDHDRNVKHALELAIKDLQMRPSIASHDTLAWALHKNGLNEQALAHSQAALQLGTKDASYHYHHATILDALGEKEQAKAMYQTCLQINPGFSVNGSAQARSAIEKLASQ